MGTLHSQAIGTLTEHQGLGQLLLSLSCKLLQKKKVDCTQILMQWNFLMSLIANRESEIIHMRKIQTFMLVNW